MAADPRRVDVVASGDAPAVVMPESLDELLQRQALRVCLQHKVVQDLDLHLLVDLLDLIIDHLTVVDRVQ